MSITFSCLVFDGYLYVLCRIDDSCVGKIKVFVYWMHIVLVGLVPVEVKWC